MLSVPDPVRLETAPTGSGLSGLLAYDHFSGGGEIACC